jgi:hypothetical protein
MCSSLRFERGRCVDDIGGDERVCRVESNWDDEWFRRIRDENERKICGIR